MDTKGMRSYLYWLFCQFELITCSYLMEPWEKVLFYTFNVAMLLTLLYTTYAFVPGHLGTALQSFLQLFGSQQDNQHVPVVK
ncbi:serine palmitoyltransferase small subunit B-like [Pogoniulus pusillus]|uniref:serine palmitoyltransferase small subunit B-like n=1 Tax=Pogoniulus pusillus TaxID=488313 RepID=UPI0030B922BB